MEKGRQLGGEPFPWWGFLISPWCLTRCEGEFGNSVLPLLPAKKRGVRFGGRDRGKLRVGSIQAHAITF